MNLPSLISPYSPFKLCYIHHRMENKRVGKVMEKMSHTWVATEISSTRNFKCKEWFRSNRFTSPGGESFRLYCYPKGKFDRHSIHDFMCIHLINDGPTEVQLTYSMEIIHQLTLGRIPFLNMSTSMFTDRYIYRRVVTLPPELGCAYEVFPRNVLTYSEWGYTLHDRLEIRVTIGIFRDPPSPAKSDHRIVFFKTADGKRFYAEDSVLRERCPTLVPKNYSVDVQLPRIEGDVFSGVLWYIYHNNLHIDDHSKSMVAKMLAAAHELGMIDLVKQLRANFLFDTLVFSLLGRRKAITNSLEDKMVVIKTTSTSSVGRVEVGERAGIRKIKWL